MIGERGCDSAADSVSGSASPGRSSAGRTCWCSTRRLSALDAETEQAITTLLDDLDEGVTVMIIAHRLSTVQHADLVVYLEDGIASAVGTFPAVREGSRPAPPSSVDGAVRAPDDWLTIARKQNAGLYFRKLGARFCGLSSPGLMPGRAR